MILREKRNGTGKALTPTEFEQNYGFEDDLDKVRLTE